MRRLLAIGADGAPGGWVATACWEANGERESELHFFGDITALATWRAAQPGGETAPVGLDMPIGLPDVVGFRACDRAARDLLSGSQKTAVFQVPSRSLIVCATEPFEGKPPNARVIFDRARTLIAEQQSRHDEESVDPDVSRTVLLRITQQTAGILAKIAEVDAFMRSGDREGWLFEVHPELSMRAMADEWVLPSKASAHGQLRRLEIVGDAFPDADQRIRDWSLGRRYSLLDICDSYAACWTALRWAKTGGGMSTRRKTVAPPLLVLGESPVGVLECDAASGLAMRMVV